MTNYDNIKFDFPMNIYRYLSWNNRWYWKIEGVEAVLFFSNFWRKWFFASDWNRTYEWNDRF